MRFTFFDRIKTPNEAAQSDSIFWVIWLRLYLGISSFDFGSNYENCQHCSILFSSKSKQSGFLGFFWQQFDQIQSSILTQGTCPLVDCWQYDRNHVRWTASFYTTPWNRWHLCKENFPLVFGPFNIQILGVIWLQNGCNHWAWTNSTRVSNFKYTFSFGPGTWNYESSHKTTLISW